MSNAIERLAIQLRKLPAVEWIRLDERRIASRDREAVMDQVPFREFAERLRAIDQDAARAGNQE